MKGAGSRLRSFPPPWSKKQRQCGRDFRGNVHKQSPTFQAGALIELSGDVDTAFEIYYETYDIHELLALDDLLNEYSPFYYHIFGWCFDSQSED